MSPPAAQQPKRPLLPNRPCRLEAFAAGLSCLAVGFSSAFNVGRHFGFALTRAGGCTVDSLAFARKITFNRVKIDDDIDDIARQEVARFGASISEMGINSNAKKNNDAIFELWLDLRGTKLTPKSALELWSIDEQEMLSLSSAMNDPASDLPPPFVKCLVSGISGQPSIGASSRSRNEAAKHQIEILLVDDDNSCEEMGNIIQQSASSSDEPSIAGKLLTVQTQPSSSKLPLLPDPLPAMETASQGKWVVLDTKGWKKVNEDERSSMVLGLIDLISSGATDSGGGIGWTCHSNSEIAKAAMWIQSMKNSNGGMMRAKSTESGILIPDEDAMLSMDLFRNNDDDTKVDPMKFALIVPYDVKLLRTAIMLINQSNNNGAADDED